MAVTFLSYPEQEAEVKNMSFILKGLAVRLKSFCLVLLYIVLTDLIGISHRELITAPIGWKPPKEAVWSALIALRRYTAAQVATEYSGEVCFLKECYEVSTGFIRLDY